MRIGHDWRGVWVSWTIRRSIFSDDIDFLQEWKNDDVPIGTQSNLAAKMYDAAVSQYIGWYDDPSLGGLENTLKKLSEADPQFGKFCKPFSGASNSHLLNFQSVAKLLIWVCDC